MIIPSESGDLVRIPLTKAEKNKIILARVGIILLLVLLAVFIIVILIIAIKALGLGLTLLTLLAGMLFGFART